MVKGKGKRLTDKQRVEIIKLVVKVGVSKREAARRYHVTENSIRNLLKDKERILSRYHMGNEDIRDERQRGGFAKHQDLEEKLYEWVKTLRARQVPLPPSLIQFRAKRMAEEMNISAFNASNGWYARFTRRNQVTARMLCGEGGDVDINDPTLVDAMEALREKVAQYPPENVYNMDETGLFYRMIPKYTVLCAHEAKDARGTKPKKDRVTLIVCTNSTGTHKIPLLMVGKAKQPAAFKSQHLPLAYISQGKAWCDSTVFRHWCENVFLPSVRARTGRPVLLLLDNAPGHYYAFEEDNVKSLFFPPNVTSIFQPMDQGVIAALKKRFKFAIFQEIVSYHEKSDEARAILYIQAQKKARGTAGIAYGRPPHLLDAMGVLEEAWEKITPGTIENCWRKSTVVASNDTFCTSEGADESALVKEMCQQFTACCGAQEDDFVADLADELTEWLHIDDDDGEIMQMQLYKDVQSLLSDESVVEEEDDVAPDTEAPWEGADLLGAAMENLEQCLDHTDAFLFLGDEPAAHLLHTIRKSIRLCHQNRREKKIDNSRQLVLHDYFSTCEQES